MNIPVCLSIPVVPCAVPELPVMGSGDYNCASPLLYLPLPSCSYYIALPSHTSAHFVRSSSQGCISSHKLCLWKHMSLQLLAVWSQSIDCAPCRATVRTSCGKILIICHKSRSTSIMKYYCEDNRGPGIVSGISVAFVKNVCYQSLTFPANGIN